MNVVSNMAILGILAMIFMPHYIQSKSIKDTKKEKPVENNHEEDEEDDDEEDDDEHNDDEDDIFHHYSFWDAASHFQRESGESFSINTTWADIRVEFFTSHDLDGDNQYDGLDLLYLVRHHHALTYRYDTMSSWKLSVTLREVMEKGERAVDRELQYSDLDRDGYLSYAEFMLAMQHHHPTTKMWT